MISPILLYMSYILPRQTSNENSSGHYNTTPIKMAASGPIRVCVHESLYAQLSQLGTPPSVAVDYRAATFTWTESAKWSPFQSEFSS